MSILRISSDLVMKGPDLKSTFSFGPEVIKLHMRNARQDLTEEQNKAQGGHSNSPPEQVHVDSGFCFNVR